MTKIILRKLKEYDTMWHPDSTLVFKSSTEKLVIGRYVNNELISLDEEALELCEKWTFKYDSSLIEEEVETDGDEEKVQDDDEEGGEENETEAKSITEAVEDVPDDGDTKDEDGSEDEETTQEETPNPIQTQEVIVNQPIKETSTSNDKFDFTVNFKFLDKYLLDFKSSIDSNNENQAQRISKLQDKLNDRNRDCEKYQKEIENHKSQYSKITDEYNKMNSEYSAIKDEYNKLKMKFEGIKNLFAL